MSNDIYPIEILLGGMRYGSTAFRDYLMQHPQVCMHTNKLIAPGLSETPMIMRWLRRSTVYTRSRSSASAGPGMGRLV
jgi:hypothetical protein